MTYNDKAPWPPASNGFSLVTVNPSSNPTPENPFSWRTSTFVGGTPYRDDTGPTAPVDPSYANIRLTEIMYNPANNPAAEFLELKNVGSSSINMTNLRLVDGVDYVFPNNTLLAAGAFYVITANTTAFQLRYSRAPSGQYTGKLSSTGDRVALYDIFGNDVLNVTYNDKSPWPGGPAQGIGLSLVLISPNSDESDPKSWRTSKSIHGSPFADDAPTGPLDTTLSVLKLTEIMYSPRTLNGYSSADLEFLELKNTGSSAVDLSGSAVVDGVYFVFPPNSMVQPGAFFVLATNATGFNNRYTRQPSGQCHANLRAAEKVSFSDHFGNTFLQLTYNATSPWPNVNGTDHSIVPVDVNSAISIDDGTYWRASANAGGSPFADDPSNPTTSSSGSSVATSVTASSLSTSGTSGGSASTATVTATGASTTAGAASGTEKNFRYSVLPLVLLALLKLVL